VPDFVPFSALRYATPTAGVADLSAVCAPPYDVIEPEDRAALLAADPHNAVRLILPDSYAAAAETFARWQTDGTLAVDGAPSFSVYRMHFVGDDGLPRVTTGVVGALELDRDGVLPHERTLPKAKSDRLELLRATRANFDPIWGLSLATGLSELLEPDSEPAATARDHEGVRHECYPITDPARVRAIRTTISGSGLVLADGHHRFETACTYRDERGADDIGAGAIMALVVELAPEQLCVRAIHRLLNHLPPVPIRDALGSAFDVRDAGANDVAGVVALQEAMRRERALGLVDTDGLALLVPTPALDQRVAELPLPLRDVDAARFDAAVLPALPGVSLAYRDDAVTVAAAVEKGNAQAAVILRPVGVDTIRAAADARVLMPEKTTFFAPKPRTGMVFRSLDL
jgi:uncharacterized protein (DUF1015 family)